jgi:hypothetical protein
MADVRLTRDEAEGQLPNVCTCCGEPASAWAEKTFMLRDPAVHGPSGFAEVHAARLLIAAAQAPRLRLRTSFCPRHRHYWSLRRALVFGGLAGLFAVLLCGVGVVVFLFAVVKVDAPWPAAFLIVPFLLYLPAWLIPLKLVQARTIRARLTGEDDRATLQNVGEGYVAAVKAARQRPGVRRDARPL